MKFDLITTLVAFTFVFGIIVIGTLTSPMTLETVVMVLLGLFVFGVLSLLIGVKHGEYRALR